MGNALNKKGERDVAIESYKNAIKIKPDYAEAFNNMGVALKERNDPSAALESFKQALKIKPDYAEAEQNIVIALCQHTQIEESSVPVITAHQKLHKIKLEYDYFEMTSEEHICKIVSEMGNILKK